MSYYFKIFEYKEGSNEFSHYHCHNIKEFGETIVKLYNENKDNPLSRIKVSFDEGPWFYKQKWGSEDAPIINIFLYKARMSSYEEFIDENGNFKKIPNFSDYICGVDYWKEIMECNKERRKKLWREKYSKNRKKEVYK